MPPLSWSAVLEGICNPLCFECADAFRLNSEQLKSLMLNAEEWKQVIEADKIHKDAARPSK